MTIDELSIVTGLTSDVVASVDAYNTVKTESSRLDALDNAIKLVRALEKPADSIYKLFASV